MKNINQGGVFRLLVTYVTCIYTIMNYTKGITLHQVPFAPAFIPSNQPLLSTIPLQGNKKRIKSAEDLHKTAKKTRVRKNSS
jgi:hypothetical protein